ncbi:ATP-binding cassette sub-family C member 9-like isoform X1 [Lytechinus variegatus]|uniref:ATP-binding cassette sub-family C member 9-like isoform X1 n=1 Tax=Lytechinus variegatus TaxID=7654 RepID=UPI001BB1F85F|nr:ATP-binding cassette sub-family C member 9-like isoform X1 [Lytechinus variegatus]
MGSDSWEWFCGTNSSDLPYFANQSWSYDDVFGNQCLVDAFIAGAQAGFFALALLVLLLIGCCTSHSNVPNRFLLRYVTHGPRYLATFVLVVISVASVAEGILTDSTYVSQPTQPHLYLTGLSSALSGVVSLLYFSRLEKWRVWKMSFLLLLYWVVSLATIGIHLEFLVYHGYNDVHVTAFDISIILVVLYSFFLVVELYFIADRWFGWSPNVDKVPHDLRDDRMYYMEFYVNFFSQLLHWWLNWLFILGFKKPLEIDDLGTIPEVHTAEYNHRRFKNNLKREIEKAKDEGREPSLFKVYFATYWVRMFIGAVLKFVTDMGAYVGPLAIGGITLYVTNTVYGEQDDVSPHPVSVSEFFADGYVLIGCIFVTALIRHMCDQTYQFITSMEGIHARSALQSTIYEKSLRLSTYAMTGGSMTMGQITNHMSVDANNIMFFFMFANEVWATPFKLIVSVVLLYLELGSPALIGASVFLVVIPFQLAAAVAMGKFIKAVLGAADYRLKMSNEMLQGIKLLKLYGWERIYYEAIKKARIKELYALLKVYAFFAVTFIINNATPIIVTLVSFGTYEPITGKVLTPDVAFTTLSLFNQMAGPLFMFPFVINLLVNWIVSTGRLKKYLLAPEVEGADGEISDLLKELEDEYDDVTDSAESAASTQDDDLAVTIKHSRHKKNSRHRKKKDDAHELPDKTPLLGANGSPRGSLSYGSTNPIKNGDTSFTGSGDVHDDVAIKISDGSFTWDPDSTEAILSDINVEIPRGKLTMVIGAVGCGKSSLLSAMLNEMTTLSGTLKHSGKTSSIAYAPQKAWLVNATLKDNVLFGEEMSSSKYRKVIQACALEPDIDMLPGKDMTEIGEKGINLSGGQKQRVSVSRWLYSDRDVIILDDPLSALDMHVGSHLFEKGIQGLLMKQKKTVILVTHQLQYLPEADKIIVMKDGRISCQGTPEEIAEADPSIMTESEKAIKEVTESEAEGSGAESESVLNERRALKKQISRQMSIGKDGSVERGDEKTGRLIEEEEKEKGSVSYKMYLYYFRAMGYWIACLMLGCVALRSGLQVATNFWLSDWSEAGLNLTGDAKSTSYYLRGYAGFSVSTVFGSVLSNIFSCIGALLAARAIHFALLKNIIGIPMRFFDTTPVGRILNRLSSDTQWIDQRLIHSCNMLLNTLVAVIASFIVNAIVNAYFVIFLVPIGFIFMCILVYFVATSRMLQRLESVTRSPVFAHFSETLGGLPIIRAYRDEKRFFKDILVKIDKNNTALVYLYTANRWLAIRLDYLGAVVVLIASLSALLGALYLDVDASLVGLAITYSLEISIYMNMVVRGCADLELQMNAMERIRYYTEVPNEEYDGMEPPPEWPQKGEIVLDNISVRYARELDPVLHDVSVTIPPGQKLGICGRTGSGKSSLTLSLFRIIDTFKGRIMVDGVDIASVPLITLRQRLSIIPQDAVLFTGTIRHNIDPAGVKTDDELWKALEIAQLKEVVSPLEGGLDYIVTEGGENFSVGQRQLFCLARAFLRNSTILVMDEATASIDQETDRILQDVVADVFQDRTVITIAHRVGTILDSDNILTLSDGRVVEFDSPNALLEKEDSVFASLVKAGK